MQRGYLFNSLSRYSCLLRLINFCCLVDIAGYFTSIPTTMAFQHRHFFFFETLTLAARAPALNATLPQVPTYFSGLALMP